MSEPWIDYPRAITGTWQDVEMRAQYLYANGAEDNDTHDLAEAVLVLLRAEYDRKRDAVSPCLI